MRKAIYPSQQRVRELLSYEPTTGVLTWRLSRGRAVAGSVAGCVCKRSGYLYVSIDRVQIAASRLIWLWMTGEVPTGDVDHRDGNTANNVWSNLRDVSHAANLQNRRRANKSNQVGLLGVCKVGDVFVASITTAGKTKSLGRFSTPEKAHAAYLSAKRALHEGNTL